MPCHNDWSPAFDVVKPWRRQWTALTRALRLSRDGHTGLGKLLSQRNLAESNECVAVVQKARVLILLADGQRNTYFESTQKGC